MAFYDNQGQINDEAINIVDGKSFQVVQLAGASGQIIDSPVKILQGLEIPAHDYILNTYDGANNLLTSTYRSGGASGTIVATLTMTYDANNNLISVTKS